MSDSHRVIHFAQNRKFILEHDNIWDCFQPIGGLPEQPLIDWARQLLRPGEIFLDVGAHCGTWGLQFASSETHVFAYEAQYSTFCQLAGGIALNRLEAHVTATHAAVSNRAGSMTFHIVAGEGGGSSLLTNIRAPIVRMETVRTISLDEERTRFGKRVGLIKIDVEGAEQLVLEGAKELLQEDAPHLLVECWDAPERAALFDYVESIGYRVVPLRGFLEMWLFEPKQKPQATCVSVGEALEPTPFVETNPAYAVARATELWGGFFQNFGEHLPPHTPNLFIHSIPSVCCDGDSLWATIRWINYHNDLHGWNCHDPQGTIRSGPELVRLEPVTLEIIERHELLDSGNVTVKYPPHPTWTRGFEDLRLIKLPTGWAAASTVTDRNPVGQSEMFLLHIGEDTFAQSVGSNRWAIYDAVQLMPPVGEPWRPQKNWVPLYDADANELLFIYQPGKLVHADGRIALEEEPPALLAGLRGSSQAIAVPVEHGGGWLYVGHHDHPAAIAHLPHPVTHRVVWLDSEKKIAKASPPFRFRTRAVEYCAGIAIYKDELLFSFAIEERHMWMHRAALTDVLASLVPCNELTS